MKIILEEKDLMSIVKAHVATTPFFNLKDKAVSVYLNVTDEGYVEVSVNISESGLTTVAATPVKRTRRSSAQVKADAEAEDISPLSECTKADEEAQVEAKKPPFEPTVVAEADEEATPVLAASKSLFA